MPPEMVTGGELTKSVDVWSFAILLLEAYASRAAWAGCSSFQTIEAVASGAVHQLGSALQSCWHGLCRACVVWLLLWEVQAGIV
jgi:serine/threonine protein kinase